MNRSLTMLNQRGDTTISWPPEHDDEMERIIAAKMAAGVTKVSRAQAPRLQAMASVGHQMEPIVKC